MEIRKNTLTPELFLELYRSVGWEPPCREQAEAALDHTLADFVAYVLDRPVGMARVIGDRGMSFYIKDFAVAPEYQSRGVGREILLALEQYIKATLPEGWAVSLELISTKEAVPFYRRMGFEERPSDSDGPGMFKMIR